MAKDTAPLIGLPMDSSEKDGLIFHSIGQKYLRAVQEVAGCLPVPLSAISNAQNIDAWLDRLSGIVMTGATSNVYPELYRTGPTVDHEPYDHPRDSLTLPLISKTLERGMPLLCICRGFQELNVVMGGSLATEVQNLEGKLDHRAPPIDDLDQRYGPVHSIKLTPGGILHDIMQADEIMVNTVHRQAIAELAAGLQVEATAPDGIIEAVSLTKAAGFALGVQWHPEYKAAANPHSVKLFKAFRAAVDCYRNGAG